MKLNQFAVYRVDQQTAGKALWHRKQFYIVSHLGLPYLRLTESDNRLELS